MLDCLDAVQMKEIAMRTRNMLFKHGPMTIAALAAKQPMKSGLEELVAYLRVARAVGAVNLAEKESIEFWDKQGIRLKAAIPKYLLSADLFPNNIEEMVL